MKGTGYKNIFGIEKDHAFGTEYYPNEIYINGVQQLIKVLKKLKKPYNDYEIKKYDITQKIFGAVQAISIAMILIAVLSLSLIIFNSSLPVSS